MKGSWMAALSHVTKLLIGAAALSVALFSAPAQAQSAGNVVAGPFPVTLPSTQTFSFATNFNVPPPLQNSYIVRVQLSAPSSLTSASLKLNGSQIFSLSDFSGGVTSADKLVTLLASDSIALSVAGAKGTKITITVFTVVMPKPSALSPNPLGINAGSSGTLTATLSPAPTASGSLNVSSNNSAAATVPASVAFASGQTSVSIPVTAVAGGIATITAFANGGQATATVNVNTLPTVSLTAPANGAIYAGPATVTVSANAADSDGTVAKVDFFDGTTPVGTATAAPYSISLTNVAAGIHSYSARATDNLGATSTSASASVTVDAAPAVTMSTQAGNAVFAAGATIALSAMPTDSVGTITKVDFYQGTTLIGTATLAPYTFNWLNVPAGNYSLTAVTTNNALMTTTSAAVPIKVDAAPSVTLDAPTGGAIYAAGTNITLSGTPTDTVGAITKVDFYQGTTLIGTATAAPYTFSWVNVAAGSYSLTAIATNDALMSGTSAVVSITVDAPPAVALTAPANGASFTAPATIPITTNTTDAVGNLTKVDFYQGSTLIGTATTSPYNFTWTNVAAGTYSLTAIATNDAGTTSASAAVSVTVNSSVALMYFIHPDHLNTPRMIADQAGTTVWRNDNTEPFGDSVPNGDPGNTGVAFEFPLRFPGQYFDRETGLVYNVMRDYSPGAGRYVESDPVGLIGGVNTYIYVNGQPLSATDLLGLLKKVVRWDMLSQYSELMLPEKGLDFKGKLGYTDHWIMYVNIPDCFVLLDTHQTIYTSPPEGEPNIDWKGETLPIKFVVRQVRVTEYTYGPPRPCCKGSETPAGWEHTHAPAWLDWLIDSILN